MKTENKDTRYYIDLDLENKTVIHWDYGQRQDLIAERLPDSQVRIYITKGQFNKLAN